ncbi:MAG: hypothetical protein ABF756_01475 [Liquorilactobacillus ghanensis]|uniref:YycH family regulatory protein n=1 Tax=Liquorilactobacillus ghanensis TaxID=399370 RepID=UPI0039EB3CF2
MKLRNVLLHSGLTITVIISIFFTAIIWLNPATFQRNSKATTATGDTFQNNDHKKIGDVFLPTQTVLNENDGLYQLSSSRIDLVQLFRQQLVKQKVQRISRHDYRSLTDYQSLLKQSNAVVFNYGSPITVKIFNQAFKQKINKYQNLKYNRILVPLNNKKVIYLMNDADKNVFKVTFNKLSWHKLKKQLKNNDIQHLPVDYELEGNQYRLAYRQAITLPSYSYLINKVNASSLVPELLNSDGQSTITTKVQKNQTIYSDGGDNRMVISNQTGKVTFSSYSDLNYYTGPAESARKHVENLSYNELLKQSFMRINSIGSSLDDVRFAGYDLTNQTAIFHSYVAGFPIISDNNYGGFKIQILNSGAQQYNFSIYSLQVMVPSSGKEVTLPSTSQVYQSLLQEGYSAAKIKGIKIGYRWQVNRSSKLVVDLLPSYFVNINGQWSNYQNLLGNSATAKTR